MATSTVTQAIMMSRGMASIVLEKFVQTLLYGFLFPRQSLLT